MVDEKQGVAEAAEAAAAVSKTYFQTFCEHRAVFSSGLINTTASNIIGGVLDDDIHTFLVERIPDIRTRRLAKQRGNGRWV